MTNLDMNTLSANSNSAVNTDGTDTWNSRDIVISNWTVPLRRCSFLPLSLPPFSYATRTCTAARPLYHYLLPLSCPCCYYFYRFLAPATATTFSPSCCCYCHFCPFRVVATTLLPLF